MKILLAVDGSTCSQAAVNELRVRPWPPGSHVKIVSAAYTGVPQPAEIALLGGGSYMSVLEHHHNRAATWAQDARNQIRATASNLEVETTVLDGPPAQVIVEEAERWDADLIVLGSHGYGATKRFLLGSVSHSVALHAPCSVEIVRSRERRPA